MSNSSNSKIAGQEMAILQMSWGIKLILVDVLHVPDIQKNLISRSWLVKRGIMLVFETDKTILMKNKDFIGKGYLKRGL